MLVCLFLVEMSCTIKPKNHSSKNINSLFLRSHGPSMHQGGIAPARPQPETEYELKDQKTGDHLYCTIMNLSDNEWSQGTRTRRRKILQPYFAFCTWLSEKGSGYRVDGSNQASCHYPNVDSASSSFFF